MLGYEVGWDLGYWLITAMCRILLNKTKGNLTLHITAWGVAE